MTRVRRACAGLDEGKAGSRLATEMSRVVFGGTQGVLGGQDLRAVSRRDICWSLCFVLRATCYKFNLTIYEVTFAIGLSKPKKTLLKCNLRKLLKMRAQSRREVIVARTPQRTASTPRPMWGILQSLGLVSLLLAALQSTVLPFYHDVELGECVFERIYMGVQQPSFPFH